MHPETVEVRDLLLAAYQEQGQHNKALMLLERLLGSTLKEKGQLHPDTLAIRQAWQEVKDAMPQQVQE